MPQSDALSDKNEGLIAQLDTYYQSGRWDEIMDLFHQALEDDVLSRDWRPEVTLPIIMTLCHKQRSKVARDMCKSLLQNIRRTRKDGAPEVILRRMSPNYTRSVVMIEGYTRILNNIVKGIDRELSPEEYNPIPQLGISEEQ